MNYQKTLNRYIFRILFIFIAMMSFLLCGVSLYANELVNTGKLNYLIIDVNGDKRVVENNKTINIVYGDILKIVSVRLKDSDELPGTVNFIGFNSSESVNGNDFGIDIFSKKIKKRWSVNENDLYKIEVSTKKEIHGEVFVRLLEPRLLYMNVLINGKEKIMREGEALIVEQSDKFKVSKVVSNVHDKEKVKYSLYEIKNSPLIDKHSRKSKVYEFRFHIEEKTFATIPLIVEEL